MPKSSSLKETKKALRAGTVGKQNCVLGQIRGWLGRLCNQAITGPRTNINSNFTDLETKMHVGFRQKPQGRSLQTLVTVWNGQGSL